MRRIRIREALGLFLVAGGEALILLHALPASRFYFPVVWFGYILVLDGFLQATGRPCLWNSARTVFLWMIPLSAGFWWIFEAFNVAVGNWKYVGTAGPSQLGYILLASLSFSTVIPAVWVTALTLAAAFSLSEPAQGLFGLNYIDGHRVPNSRVALDNSRSRLLRRLMPLSLAFGVLCIALPVLFPRYSFGLIWGALFFVLDPLNYWLGYPSLIEQVSRRRFSTVIAFSLAGLICGFFWEAWNYWSLTKWVYNVPFVSQAHLFEMPLPGYLGYIPFGLEVFAVTVFGLSTVAGLKPLVVRIACGVP